MRNFARRLDKVAASIGDTDHCPACHYPRDVTWYVTLEINEQLGTCQSCGHKLDPDGKPLHELAKVIVLPVGMRSQMLVSGVMPPSQGYRGTANEAATGVCSSAHPGQ